MSLEDLKKKIEQKAKGCNISMLSESDICKHDVWLSTPAYDLNRILSGSLYRAFPNRSLLLIVGQEHSFKSSFMALCIAQAQKEGFKPVIIDTEGGFTEPFAIRWGIDPKKALYIYEPFVDNVCVILAQILDSDEEKLAIILDSVGGLETEKLLEDGIKGDVKADQGTLAKKIKRMLKLLLAICKKKKSFSLISGHLVGNPNAGIYGQKEDIGGGNFVKLAPDIVITLKKSKIQDDKKNITGNLITATTVKNRFYPPFSQGKISIDYKNGIDSIAGLMEIALDTGIVVLEGRTYSLKDGTKLAVGEEKAYQAFRDNPEQILQEIEEYIKNTGYSTVNENVKKAEELLKGEE